jgi:hypothetical protein
MLVSDDNIDEMNSVLNNLQQMEDLFAKSPTLLLANNNKAFNVEFTSAQLDPDPGDYYIVRWELNVYYSTILNVEIQDEPIIDDNDDPPSGDILLGDANLDGTVNVADIVQLVQFILNANNDYSIESWNSFINNNGSNVDMDNSGQVNVADIVQLVQQILN